MRRTLIALIVGLLLQLLVGFTLAQDRLAGRWEGKVQSIQGERDAAATFKKEGDAYTGSITGVRGDVPFKDIKVDGSRITAQAEIESPQGTFTVHYTFLLEEETLKGRGEIDFNGQTFDFTYELRRAGEKVGTAATQARPKEGAATQQAPRQQVPQPQQKQSLGYFAGQWAFKYIGRESALGPAPREGTATFLKSADGKSLNGRLTSQSDSGQFQENLIITFDEATKMITFFEQRSNGVKINSRGDWSSPVSIRFTVEPIKGKAQTLQLRRTIAIIAAHSFMLTEELSEDGGPFVRLGNALFSKVGGTK